MAAEPQQAVTLYEAIRFLGPLIGGGGLTAIAVAWLGSRRGKTEDRKPEHPPTLGIQALLADHLAMERFTTEIRRQAEATEDLTKAINRACDMMDISAALKRLQMHD